MKTLLTLSAAVAVLLLISMPVASQVPQGEKSFSGTLGKVDDLERSITVKGTADDQQEMTFAYDAKTLVTGAERTVYSLAGKPGARLKITYREQGGERIATRIEVAETKS